MLLSDLLSGVLLEELGVELELVSWLCARAPGAASASANTDNAVNLIGKPPGIVVSAKVGDGAPRSQRTTPREAARGPDERAPVGPKHEEPDPSGIRLSTNFAFEWVTPRKTNRSHTYASHSGS